MKSCVCILWRKSSAATCTANRILDLSPPQGVNFPNPDGNFSTGVGGACPQGSYCPEGTSLPWSCPRGTYSDGSGEHKRTFKLFSLSNSDWKSHLCCASFQLTDILGCSPCLPGHYCGNVGLTRPSGLCQAGFYCPGGDSAATGQSETRFFITGLSLRNELL